MDCLLTNISDDEYNNIWLGIDLCHLTTIPRISAEVIWGSDLSSFTVAEFYERHGAFTENALIVSDEVLEDLYKDLPRLYAALFEALKGRKPLNEC